MRLEAASSAQRMLELLALGRASRAPSAPAALQNAPAPLPHSSAAPHRAASGLSSSTLAALIHLQAQPTEIPSTASAQPAETEPTAQDEAVDAVEGPEPVEASEVDELGEASDVANVEDSEDVSSTEDADEVTASDEAEDASETSSADEAEGLETAWDDDTGDSDPTEMTADVQTTAHVQAGAILAAQQGAPMPQPQDPYGE